jgi:hypothetical protein
MPPPAIAVRALAWVLEASTEEMGLLVAERTSAVAHSKEDLQEWRAKLMVPCRLGLCVCHLGLWHLAAGLF